MSSLDPIELRNAFGKFMTGVTVVTTTADDGTPVGFTANSFSSVSLDPPLLLVCPAKTMSSFEIFEHCEYFHISVLAHDQQAVSNRFASPVEDRFSDTDWSQDAYGSPKIDGAIASFSCKRDRSIDAGDHIVMLGEVCAFASNEQHGLGYREGGYFSLEMERKATELQTHDDSKLVIAGALIEQEDGLLLASDESGKLSIPSIQIDDDQPSFDLLEQYLEETLQTPVSVGSVFSVFDNTQSNKASIYYRATLDQPIPVNLPGYALMPLEQLDPGSFASDAITTMLTRFLAERESGNHSIYIGDETSGTTHKIVTPPNT
ncbi:MAG: flavin reductase family protein [Pseudomonadota bacterium]